MDRSKIERYAAGGAELVKAYWGLNIAELNAKQPDGSWTLHQIAIHHRNILLKQVCVMFSFDKEMGMHVYHRKRRSPEVRLLYTQL